MKQQKHQSHDGDLSHGCDGQRAPPINEPALEWAGLKTVSDPMDCLTARAAFQYTYEASFPGCVPYFQARGTRVRLIYSFLCLFMCILASR